MGYVPPKSRPFPESVDANANVGSKVKLNHGVFCIMCWIKYWLRPKTSIEKPDFTNREAPIEAWRDE